MDRLPGQPRERADGALGLRPLDLVLDPLRQLAVALPRLADVVVRALAEPLEPVVLFLLGGQHDDRDVARAVVRAQAMAGLEAVHARHHDVEEHEVGLLAQADLERLLSVLGDEHRVAFALEDESDRFANPRLVVGDENAGLSLRHDALPSPRVAPTDPVRDAPARGPHPVVGASPVPHEGRRAGSTESCAEGVGGLPRGAVEGAPIPLQERQFRLRQAIRPCGRAAAEEPASGGLAPSGRTVRGRAGRKIPVPGERIATGRERAGGAGTGT